MWYFDLTHTPSEWRMASSTNLSDEPSQPPNHTHHWRLPGPQEGFEPWVDDPGNFFKTARWGMIKTPQKSLFLKGSIAKRVGPTKQLSMRKMNGFWWKNWWFSNKLWIFWWKFMLCLETNRWNILYYALGQLIQTWQFGRTLAWRHQVLSSP